MSFVSGSSNTKDHEAEEYLLDGDPSTKWCGDFGDGFENYVIFTAGGPSVLTSYTLTTGGDTGTDGHYVRNWTEWTIYGSNSPDGGWVEINHETGVELPNGSNEISKPFTVVSRIPYRYFKLEVNTVRAANFGSQQMADGDTIGGRD